MTNLKPSALLEIDDSYVYASWLTDDNHQVIAIYRDHKKDGAWSLEQFRGPFSNVIDGTVRNDSDHPLYWESAKLAITLHGELNESLDKVKSEWDGELYDR